MISIIIPNYNGEAILEKNIPSVIDAGEFYKHQSGDAVEIILIDDRSSDRSVEVIKKIINSYPKTSIVFYQNTNNLGFSSTVNVGVKKAKGEIVILLNTDVVPEKDFILPLITHFAKEDVFAVGCMDKSIEKSGFVLRGRGVGKWEKGFLLHAAGTLDKENTLWVSCGSGAFRRSMWIELNGLCELYNPFYWEDIDLSYRAQKFGYRVLFEKRSVVSHFHMQGAIKKYHTDFEIKTISYRNQLFFVWLNVTDWEFLLSHGVWLPYHVLVSIKRFDWAFLYGLFKALLHSGSILRHRIKVVDHVIKSDKEVIEQNS